jgi:hypothetical protein
MNSCHRLAHLAPVGDVLRQLMGYIEASRDQSVALNATTETNTN